MMLVNGGAGSDVVFTGFSVEQDEDEAASAAAASGERMTMRVGIKTGSHSDTWGAGDAGTLLLLDAVIPSNGPNGSSSMIMTMTMRC